MKAVINDEEERFATILAEVNGSPDSEYDFSGSRFHTAHQIQHVFNAINYKPEPITLIMNSCSFNEENACVQQLKLSLASTDKLREFEFKQPKFSTQMMHVIVRGLCRNHWLEAVTVDSVHATPAMISDLVNHPRLVVLSIEDLQLTHEIAQAFHRHFEGSRLKTLRLPNLTLVPNGHKHEAIIAIFEKAVKTIVASARAHDFLPEQSEQIKMKR